MKYISTRGKASPVSFADAVLEGLARDGGLFVPETTPDFTDKLDAFHSLTYSELAFEIFKPFVEGSLDDTTLKKIIEKSYARFDADEVTPLRFFNDFALLELFHGPTLAFKDVALQFLGNLFEVLLKQRNRNMNIIGATSGDTGSAAIHGVRGKEGISIFMLHPKGRVSPVQELQMVTVTDENVHNIAIHGTFDDAQAIVKELFNDLNFRDQYQLGAVNSINWARIMAQIVYYFYAAAKFQNKYPGVPLRFSVPTGNFGDIFAGYMAFKMGLPIQQLILATNENNILAKTLQTGTYKIEGVVPTISPSMDIQVSSNFERYLFDLLGRDGEKVQAKMDELTQEKEFSLSTEELKKAQELFKGVDMDTERTLATIKKASQEDVILDPHSAVGVAAALSITTDPVICLATAHPAKFPDAVQDAVGHLPEAPESVKQLHSMPKKMMEAEADASEIQSIVEKYVK